LQTQQNIRVIFDSGPLAHYVTAWRLPWTKKYTTYCTVVKGGPSHGHG